MKSIVVIVVIVKLIKVSGIENEIYSGQKIRKCTGNAQENFMASVFN